MTQERQADKLESATEQALHFLRTLTVADCIDRPAVVVTHVEMLLSGRAAVPELQQRGEPVTQDGPIAGTWTTVGQPAAELDLILTQLEIATQGACDDSVDTAEQEEDAALALKIKREIIEKYTPRSGDAGLLPELREYFVRLKHRADVRGGPDVSAMGIADEAIALIDATPLSGLGTNVPEAGTPGSARPLLTEDEAAQLLDDGFSVKVVDVEKPGRWKCPHCDMMDFDGHEQSCIIRGLVERLLGRVVPFGTIARSTRQDTFDYAKAYVDLFDLINSDSMAITFQSLGQYRAWLLQCIRAACPDAPGSTVPSASGRSDG